MALRNRGRRSTTQVSGAAYGIVVLLVADGNGRPQFGGTLPAKRRSIVIVHLPLT